MSSCDRRNISGRARTGNFIQMEADDRTVEKTTRRDVKQRMIEIREVYRDT